MLHHFAISGFQPDLFKQIFEPFLEFIASYFIFLQTSFEVGTKLFFQIRVGAKTFIV